MKKTTTKTNNKPKPKPQRPKQARRPTPTFSRPRSMQKSTALAISNTLFASAPKLTLRDMKQFDTVRTSTWHMHSFNANPGCPAMFPWVSGIAKQFDQFVTRRLTFHYKAACPMTQAGTIGLFFDYDVADDNSGITSEQLSNMSRAVVGSVHDNHTYVVDIAQLLDRRHRTFITNEEDTKDPLRSLGRFWYGVEAPNLSAAADAPNASIGTMWVEFDFDLVNPEAVAPNGVSAVTLGGQDKTRPNGNSPFGDKTQKVKMTTAEALQILANINPKELLKYGNDAVGIWETLNRGKSFIPTDAHPSLGLTLPDSYDGGTIVLGDIPPEAGLLVITGHPPGSLIQVEVYIIATAFAAADIVDAHPLDIGLTISDNITQLAYEDENADKAPVAFPTQLTWSVKRVFRLEGRGPHVLWPRLRDNTTHLTFAGPFTTHFASTIRIFDVPDLSGAPFYTDGL